MTSGRPSRSRGDVEGEIRIGYRMAGIGFEVATEVAAGALIGWGIDAWLDSEPKGLLIGAILGIAVGMWSLVNGTLKLNREMDRQHPTAGRGKPIPPPDDEGEKDPWDDWNDDGTDRQP